MTGLLKDIQGYFKAEFSGRYLAVLLRELASREPQAFYELLCLAGRKDPTGLTSHTADQYRKRLLNPEIEHHFKARNRTRRADLALCDAEGNAAALLEIKEFDHRNPRNSSQLRDYLHRAERTKTPFIYLTRFSPERDELEALRVAAARRLPVSEIRYRDVFSVFAKSEGNLAKLLANYLKDNGVATYQTIRADKSLPFLVTRMLCFPHRNGLGRLNSDAVIALADDTLGSLFSNLEILGEWVKDKNRDLFKTRFTRDFFVEPDFEDRSRDRICSGTVYFYASGSLRNPSRAGARLEKNDYLYLELGYRFEAETGERDRPIRYSVYTKFRGKSLSDNGDDTLVNSTVTDRFPTEAHSMRALSRCLESSARKARKLTLPASYSAILGKLKVPTP